MLQVVHIRRSSLIAAFVAGLLSGAALTATASHYPFDKLHVFAEALSRIDAFYVDDRNTEELVYDAIGGLTQGLDDHSVFLDPERYRQMREQTSGEYFGVGIEVETRDERVWVVVPLEGSPAEQAGIAAGHRRAQRARGMRGRPGAHPRRPGHRGGARHPPRRRGRRRGDPGPA